MHEMSLAESALQIIVKAAAANNLRRVRKIHLEISQLMAVEPQSLRCCLESVARGSLADGAELEITEVPGTGWCEQCATRVPMSEIIATCPRCGNGRLQPSDGMGMRVTTLEGW
jgi:hydrogenase nickel incorporation protein HypA/HybF